MSLDATQQRVLDEILAFVKDQHPHEFQVHGRAGVGKTTLIAELARNLECPVLAPTNKAAAVLRSKGIIAQTAHSYLYIPAQAGTPDQIKEARERLAASQPRSPQYLMALEDLRALKHLTFVLKPTVESAPVAVVDESSMIPTRLGQDLTTVVPQVVAFGDPWQLPPVNAKAYFSDPPDATLTKVYRQGRGSGILDMAFTAYKTGRASTYTTDARTLTGSSLTIDRYLARLGAADKILVGTHFTRRLLNHCLRYERGLPPVPVDGDTLTCVRSPSLDERDAGLVNGFTYEVVKAELVENGAYIALRLKDVLSGDLVKFSMSTRHFLLASLPLKLGATSDVDDGPPLDFDHAMTTHKCCHPDTLVEMGGLYRIGGIPDRGLVATPTGPQRYWHKVAYPEGPALRIVCEGGYRETVTLDHKMEVWRDGDPVMVRAAAVQCGDWMRLRLGTESPDPPCVKLHPPVVGDIRAVNYTTPSVCDAELAEFLGLMVADGTVYKGGFRLVKRHRDVGDRFGELCRKVFGLHPVPIHKRGADGFEASSTNVAAWLRQVDGLQPKTKAVPSVILASPLRVQAAFLRGLFEDGTVNIKTGPAGFICFSSAYLGLADTVQTMLLRFGIISSYVTLATGGYAVYIWGAHCAKFRDAIGFVSAFKNTRLQRCIATESRYRVPLTRAEIAPIKTVQTERNNVYMRGYTSREKVKAWLGRGGEHLRWKLDWHWVRVVRIAQTTCPSVCIEVPNGHVFLQNGFPHGNSQGSEWPHVVVQDEAQVFGPFRKRWLYTAITRAKDRCIVISGRPNLKAPPRSYTKEYV